MSATSFLDNPLLKVSRPVAACSRCRTAKIKCDGKLPACSACERAGKASTCSGASDEFAKGKERSYVASLEGYCERLEKKIANLHHRQSTSHDGTGVVRESSITSVSTSGALAQEHRKEVSDIDDLVGDFGFLSVNATSRDFRGITSSTSFANLLLDVSVVEPLQSSTSQSLPPRHEATPLLQYYFDNVFTRLPFFTETSFWTSVDAVYQSGGRFAKPFDHWILRMVLGIASASLSYRSGDKNHQRAISFVAGAMQYSEDVLHPGSILGIQAILLLAQYSLVDPMHFRTWYLVGMAVRVMVDLGLHQDPPSEVLSTSERLTLRRKVFHCIYGLDRVVSTALGRTLSFSDNSVNVVVPTASGPMGSSLGEANHVFLRSSGPALHMVQIRQILSTGYRKMYFQGREPSPQPLEETWSMCSQAQEWFDNAPTDVPPNFPVLYRLELLYATAILLSPSHRYPSICDYNKVLLFDRCIDYVSLLHQTLENPSLMPFMTFLDVQRAYQLGRRFVEILTHDYDLALSPSSPAPPPLPHGFPDPPFIDGEGRINCHARAVRCLSHVRDLLQFSTRKWDMRVLSEQFEKASAPVQKRLMQSSMVYLPGSGPYIAGGPSVIPSSRDGYPGFDPGYYGN